jgi:hypothetical protein
VTHTKKYDLLGRIKAISAGLLAGTVLGTEVQNGVYGFDGLGNLRNRSDSIAGLAQETFDYDLLNRVTSATRGTTSYSYGYQAGGNLLTKGDLTALGCTANDLTYGDTTRSASTGQAGPHAVRTVCGRTLNYDLTGNVVSDGLRSYNNYTAFNLPPSRVPLILPTIRVV